MYGNSGNVAGVVAGTAGLAYTGITGLPWIVGGGIALVVGGVALFRMATRGRRSSRAN